MSADMPLGPKAADQGPAARLLRNRDFISLWAGQSVSLIGSSVSFIGLPLVAVLILHVSPFQLGLISAIEVLPPVVVGPFIGPLVDKHSRHRLMIIADVGRAALLATIPIAFIIGVLALWLMVVVAFLTGILTALFNVAFQAFLPNLVAAEQLGDGNAKLSASQSASELTGPGIAAGLIALGGSSTAVAADALSYAFSAYCLFRIKVRDTGYGRLVADGGRSRQLSSFWHEIQVGFSLLRRDAVLMTVTRSNAILTFFAQMLSAVYFLFLTKNLHFSPYIISLIFTAAGIIGLLSAFGCNRLAARIGFGRLLITGQLIMALGGALLALAEGPKLEAASFITGGEACFGIGLTLFGVGYTTLFQLRTEDEVRGRIIGAARFITAASVPFAAIIAGVIGSLFGLRTALIVGAIGMALGLAAVLSPRVWKLAGGRRPYQSV
jgi:MFS family permease